MPNQTAQAQKILSEGYVYHSYGNIKYLKHAIASVISLKRFDDKRPVGLLCPQTHIDILEKEGLSYLFDTLKILPQNHQSIVGFKHHLHQFMLFDKNIFLDSDIIWCKNPDTLWQSFAPHPFTSTGTLLADPFFGAAKNGAILIDLFLRKRQKTLKRFGITQLSRVQSGLVYAAHVPTTQTVCEKAQYFLANIHQTHFQSRLNEKGRNEESCEWSLAMAMAQLKIGVFPWLNGYQSPQLDFIASHTKHNTDFTSVECRFYTNEFVYNLRGLKNEWLKKWLTQFFTLLPGKGDFMMVTPYCLHFGWLHQKQPFLEFADKIWENLTAQKSTITQHNNTAK